MAALAGGARWEAEVASNSSVEAGADVTVVVAGAAVAEVAVVGIPDDRLGELGCAFVTLQPGSGLDLAEMIRYLDELGTAKQYWPEHLEVIDEMPRTPSGKIQKFKLREMAAAFSR